MKLVEIKDVRVGQVWQFGENMCRCFVVERTMKTKTCGATYQAFDCPTMPEECKGELYIKDYDMPKIPHGRLIGKLGITHRIEDGKLVEIPRTAEFQIDDVCYTLSFYNTASPHFDIGVDFEDIIFVIDNMDTYENGTLLLFDARGNEYRPDDVEKIGILGVTHEFVNDREAANE